MNMNDIIFVSWSIFCGIVKELFLLEFCFGVFVFDFSYDVISVYDIYGIIFHLVFLIFFDAFGETRIINQG